MKERINKLVYIIGVGYIVLATVTAHGATTVVTYQPQSHPLAQNKW